MSWKAFWKDLDTRAEELPRTREALKEMKGHGIRWKGVTLAGTWKAIIHARSANPVTVTAANGAELLAKVRAVIEAEQAAKVAA